MLLSIKIETILAFTAESVETIKAIITMVQIIASIKDSSIDQLNAVLASNTVDAVIKSIDAYQVCNLSTLTLSYDENKENIFISVPDEGILLLAKAMTGLCTDLIGPVVQMGAILKFGVKPAMDKYTQTCGGAFLRKLLA